MIFFIVIVAIVVLALVVNYLTSEKQEEKNEEAQEEYGEQQRIEQEKTKVKYDIDLANMKEKYGEVANKISFEKYSLENEIIVFHDTKNVWICGKIYSYDNILSCSYHDDAQTIKGETEYKTKTSTGSMIGRAVVGGVLTGGIGAAVGAATAGKKTVASSKEDKVLHDYTVFINTNVISNPVLRIACGDDIVLVHEITGLMNAVISHKG